MSSFKFVRDWFLKAGNEAKRQGRKDASELWKDGLAQLDNMHSELTALRARNEKLEDFVRAVEKILDALANLNKEPPDAPQK